MYKLNLQCIYRPKWFNLEIFSTSSTVFIPLEEKLK